MNFKRSFVLTASVIALASCATVPPEHEVKRSQIYSESRDVIWERAVKFYADRNLSIHTIEKVSGIIAADRRLISGEAYADCSGGNPLMRRQYQAMELNLFVRLLPDGTTTVTVNARFIETRIALNNVNISTMNCSSTGVLEQEILGALSHPI